MHAVYSPTEERRRSTGPSLAASLYAFLRFSSTRASPRISCTLPDLTYVHIVSSASKTLESPSKKVTVAPESAREDRNLVSYRVVNLRKKDKWSLLRKRIAE